MLDLYFAGQVTDHVDKCLFDMGANHLFSYLNERKNAAFPPARDNRETSDSNCLR